MNQGTLSLILPAHNEEATLAAVVHECLGVLRYHFSDFEIIIVDDGSSDNTPRIATELAASYDPVVVLHHRRNRGYGAALISGFEAARGDYYLVMDADRQYSIGDIARFTPYIDRYDIVAGYRFRRQEPRYWVAMSEAFNRLITLLFKLNLHDINCGFKLFRADVIHTMQLTSHSVLINIEMHAKAALMGARVVEVGVNHYQRFGSRYSSTASRVARRSLRATALLWWRLRSYAPPGEQVARLRTGWQRKALFGGALAAVLGGAWTLRRRR